MLVEVKALAMNKISYVTMEQTWQSHKVMNRRSVIMKTTMKV